MIFKCPKSYFFIWKNFNNNNLNYFIVNKIIFSFFLLVFIKFKSNSGACKNIRHCELKHSIKILRTAFRHNLVNYNNMIKSDWKIIIL